MTTTTNYGWTKPTVNSDANTWGTSLNSDLDGIDSTVKSVSNVAAAALVATSASEIFLGSGNSAIAVSSVVIPLTAGYNAYRLVLMNVEPSTDGDAIYLRASIDGGSTYLNGASAYAYAGTTKDSGGTGGDLSSDGAAAIMTTGAMTATAGYGSQAEIYISTDGVSNNHIIYSTSYITQTALKQATNRGSARTAAVTTRLTHLLAFGAGNVARYRYALYGLRGI